MNGLRSLLIGKRINRNLMSYHERAVKTETEMTDDLVLIGFVLILLKEIRRAGKCNLVDVFLNLIGGHADSVINKGDRLLLRIGADRDLPLVVVRKLRLADQSKLFKLRHRITAV